MDIMELGAIGELVGGVAVIGSLIYVGLQVRQSNQLNRAESVRAYVRDYNALVGKLTDPEFAELMRKASVDFNDLSRNDQLRAHGWLLPHVMLGFGNFFVDREGVEPLSVLADQSNAITISAPGFSQWWEVFGPALPDDYKNRMARAQGYVESASFHEIAPWMVPDNFSKDEA